MKKTLKRGASLALAAMMLIGILTMNASAAGYFSPAYDDTTTSPNLTAITALTRAGIMNGIGNGQFAPNAAFDRAAAVTILGRLAGAESGADTGSWYSGYAKWAAANGIIAANETFQPKQIVTGQEMDAMLAACAKAIGVEYTASNTSSTPLTRAGAAEMVYGLYKKMAPTVNVTGGTIQGSFSVTGVKSFLGIPYAADAGGENRFKAPQPVKPWEGVRDCTTYGPIAMQKEVSGGFGPYTPEYLDVGMTFDNGKMSEDCLRLNVWTSADAGDNLPVIVYIHGGSNNSGSGSNEIYTGEGIAQRDVVYVTINYRVGIFGFLAYQDSTGEEVRGNFAIQDQIAALKWVQENIAAFGGDPSRVTIAGQSSGARNVLTLMASPAAAGLFQGAVAMSATTYTPSALEKAEKTAAEKLGEYTLADLRAMSSTEVQALTSTYNPTQTVIDGEIITGTLQETFDSGKYNAVNMLWGWVAGDGPTYGTLSLPDDDNNPWTPVLSVSPADYRTALESKFGAEGAEECLRCYPIDENAPNVIEVAEQVNLGTLISTYYHGAMAKNNGDSAHKTYLYSFVHPLADTPERMKEFGAFHTADVSYWLNYYSSTSSRPWSDVDYALGDAMSSYLVNFAATGNPNGVNSTGAPLPQWKASNDTEAVSYLELGDTAVWTEMDADTSAFWMAN